MNRAFALPSLPALPVISIGLAIGVAVAAALALSWLGKKVAEEGAMGAAEWLGKAAGDVPAGVVLGIGDSIGIPRTNQSECDRALSEGRTWDASFACPAARFISEGIFGSTPARAGASGVW